MFPQSKLNNKIPYGLMDGVKNLGDSLLAFNRVHCSFPSA